MKKAIMFPIDDVTFRLSAGIRQPQFWWLLLLPLA
jgi:hypothetical protein